MQTIFILDTGEWCDEYISFTMICCFLYLKETFSTRKNCFNILYCYLLIVNWIWICTVGNQYQKNFFLFFKIIEKNKNSKTAESKVVVVVVAVVLNLFVLYFYLFSL